MIQLPSARQMALQYVHSVMTRVTDVINHAAATSVTVGRRRWHSNVFVIIVVNLNAAGAADDALIAEDADVWLRDLESLKQRKKSLQ